MEGVHLGLHRVDRRQRQMCIRDSLSPIHSDGASPGVRKTVPYSAAFAWTGHKGQSFNYKYLEVQDKVVSAKDYDKARDQWKKEKEKSNKKAQEELEKHVK